MNGVRSEPRGRPLPDTAGAELLAELLADIEEEEELSRALGVDLTPPGPRPEHFPRVYAPLDVWLARSEEVHALREAAWSAERGSRRHEHPRAVVDPARP
jgi:hypothetical protein